MVPQVSVRAGRVAVALVAAVSVFIVASGAGASASPSASDPVHANFVAGNVVSCDQIGLPNSTTLFADGDSSLSGAVTGTVEAHAGGGQEANITAVAAGVVIDAIVVKGGSAYNVYLPDPPGSGSGAGSHVFPTYSGPYIAPLNSGGNIPALSHWFVCYHGGEVPPPPLPPGPGSLVVTKAVNNPGGVTTPANYTVHIVCDDGTNVTRTLPGAGGPAIEGPVTNITANSFCTVTETSALPANAAATYSPASAGPDGEGVAVGSGVQVSVTVTNTFTAVGGEVVTKPPATETVQVAVAAEAVTASPAFTG
jgi:hypothetical protein